MKPRLMEIIAMNSMAAAMPRVACWPEYCAILSGPPNSETERLPVITCTIVSTIILTMSPVCRIAAPITSVGASGTTVCPLGAMPSRPRRNSFPNRSRSCSAVGDAVYEPFSGSGTTIIAAETTARRCYAMEIDPRYVDIAVLRWQALTGKNAALTREKEEFDQGRCR